MMNDLFEGSYSEFSWYQRTWEYIGQVLSARVRGFYRGIWRVGLASS